MLIRDEKNKHRELGFRELESCLYTYAKMDLFTYTKPMDRDGEVDSSTSETMQED